MKTIEGGICAAKGFRANGIHCGIRKNKSKRDLSLVVSDVKATAAAVYTTNLVKGAPIFVNQKHLADGHAQAIICNSGIANTCNADGIEKAEAMGQLVEDALGINRDDVIVGSTKTNKKEKDALHHDDADGEHGELKSQRHALNDVAHDIMACDPPVLALQMQLGIFHERINKGCSTRCSRGSTSRPRAPRSTARLTPIAPSFLPASAHSFSIISSVPFYAAWGIR